MLDDFADHIVGLQYNKETNEFNDVSEVIEKLKNEGDEDVKELLMNSFFGVMDEHLRRLTKPLCIENAEILKKERE